MVRRLVHEQRPRVPAVGVPAPEVVGAVHRIEIPVEVDRGDVADPPRGESSLDPPEVGAKR